MQPSWLSSPFPYFLFLNLSSLFLPCLLSRTKQVYGREVLLLWKTPNSAEHKISNRYNKCVYGEFASSIYTGPAEWIKVLSCVLFFKFHLCSFCKILKMMVQSRFWRTPDVTWMNFWDSSSHKLVFVLNSNSQMFSAGRHILRLCDLLLVVAMLLHVFAWMGYSMIEILKLPSEKSFEIYNLFETGIWGYIFF